MTAITHWIGGKPWTGDAARRGDVYNPASGQVTGHVDFASEADVDAAVAAAAQALPGWRATSLTKRTSILFAFRELVKQNITELNLSMKIFQAVTFQDLPSQFTLEKNHTKASQLL